MPRIAEKDAYRKFLSHGRNSSHFVWFLTRLDFFECSNGWIFAFLSKGSVTIFALEPLVPEDSYSGDAFHLAWEELKRELKPRIALFVSVNDEFLHLLKARGFQSIQVGREPFVDLAQCIPTGKSGKGVRAARNQALRAGVITEEVSGEQIRVEKKIQDEMRAVLAQWKSRNLFEMGGFLNTVNPFLRMEDRRYFLSRDRNGRLDGYLVATPIPRKKSFFLEDLVLRKNSSRGSGELLMLEGMAALAEAGGSEASLGVVALTNMNDRSGDGLPKMARFVLVSLPKFLQRFYNVKGLETFRKRFKPQRWESVHLALLNSSDSGVGDDRAWFKALLVLFASFRPRWNFSWRLPLDTLFGSFARHPFSYLTCVVSTASFAFVNRFEVIPPWALKKFGFSGDSPLSEWCFRSITSDFLFFDPLHFWTSVFLLFFLLRWMERSYPLKFGALILAGGIIFDDIINQFLLIAPYSYFHPHIFQRLIAIKDVGPSLWVALVLGLQMCTIRKNREIIFAILSIAIVLTFAFSAAHYSSLILNLNHSLFFALGFILGKLRFEYDRRVSKRMARQKPPVAKSVLTHPKRRASDRTPSP